MPREYHLKPSPGQPQREKLTDESFMQFGMHKGKTLGKVPASYLLWLWNNGLHAQPNKPLHHYVKDNMAAFEMDAPDVIIDHDPRKDGR